MRDPGIPYGLRRLAVAALLFISAGIGGVGCAPSVGDSCETNVECPSGAICDNTAPEGYCTFSECERGGCPEGSVCVFFDRELSFCMAACESAEECREGYTCRKEPGPVDFCYTAGAPSDDA